MKRTILISTLANGLTSQPNQKTVEEKVAVMFGDVNSDLSQCYDILPGMSRTWCTTFVPLYSRCPFYTHCSLTLCKFCERFKWRTTVWLNLQYLISRDCDAFRTVTFRDLSSSWLRFSSKRLMWKFNPFLGVSYVTPK